MALRALLSRWPKTGIVAAGSIAAGGVALCDGDIRGQMFDPEALERGAKALREINQSPHAKRVSRCFQDVSEFSRSSFKYEHAALSARISLRYFIRSTGSANAVGFSGFRPSSRFNLLPIHICPSVIVSMNGTARQAALCTQHCVMCFNNSSSEVSSVPIC